MDKYEKCSRDDRERKEKLQRVLRSQIVGQSIRESNRTGSLCETQDYLSEKKVFDTFHFLLGHLAVYQPTNPFQYLCQLLDDCISFRSGFKESRLLWTKGHVDMVFQSINSGTSELLSLDDYKTAMKTLGIRSYNSCPGERVPGFVDRQTFCTEALNSLKNEFADIINATTRRVSPVSFCDALDV